LLLKCNGYGLAFAARGMTMDGATNPDSSAADQARLKELVDRFAAAARDNGAADLGTFLPATGDPLRRPALLALVEADLEARWRRGESILLERYQERYPDLAPGGDWPAALVYEEYRVRHHYGDCPSLGTYQPRFPRQFEQLRRLVAAHP